MKIFAYGSNMNIKRIKQRVPSAIKVSNAFIKNYTMICNKVSRDGSSKANIVQTDNPNDIVWGIIFEISDNEKADLDKAEGLGRGYLEAIFNFTDTNNKIHQAQVYIAHKDFINNNLVPYDWYKQIILSGAKQNELPDYYLEKIQYLDFITDPNEERRQENLSLV
ncbi:gamma-glutamylcyclotransferase family protein [Emticicia fontis]